MKIQVVSANIVHPRKRGEQTVLHVFFHTDEAEDQEADLPMHYPRTEDNPCPEPDVDTARLTAFQLELWDAVLDYSVAAAERRAAGDDV